MDQGARLAALCATCHDPGGQQHGIPSIANLKENEIVEALTEYRRDESSSIVMHAIGISLSDEELASVARYLASRRRHIP